MKRILKSRLVMFLITAIVFTSVGVLADNLLASEINYGSGTVADALNDLYGKVDNFCKKITGNSTTIGSKYECDPGDGIYRIFYVLKVNNDLVDLIMDRNINYGSMTYNNAILYFTTGDGSSLGWTNVESVSLPKAQDIANAVGNINWDVTTAADNNWFYLDSKNGVYGQTQIANTSNPSAYGWLYANTKECYSYGCPINTSLDSTASFGYWTQDKIYNDSSKAWAIHEYGRISAMSITDSTHRGVRPVITVNKNNL